MGFSLAYYFLGFPGILQMHKIREALLEEYLQDTPHFTQFYRRVYSPLPARESCPEPRGT